MYQNNQNHDSISCPTCWDWVHLMRVCMHACNLNEVRGFISWASKHSKHAQKLCTDDCDAGLRHILLTCRKVKKKWIPQNQE